MSTPKKSKKLKSVKPKFIFCGVCKKSTSTKFKLSARYSESKEASVTLQCTKCGFDHGYWRGHSATMGITRVKFGKADFNRVFQFYCEEVK